MLLFPFISHLLTSRVMEATIKFYGQPYLRKVEINDEVSAHNILLNETSAKHTTIECIQNLSEATL